MSNPKSELEGLWEAMASDPSDANREAFNTAFKAENSDFPGVKAMDNLNGRDLAILEGDTSGRYPLGALFQQYSVKEPEEPVQLRVVSRGSKEEAPTCEDTLTPEEAALLGMIGAAQRPPDFSHARDTLRRMAEARVREDDDR